MTQIPFATKAWPIVTGCTKTKKGCRECYAARLAATRLKHHKHYRGLAEYRDGRGHWVAPPRFNADILEAPLRWRKSQRIFVAHTGDLFHKDIADSDIERVWDVMWECFWHTFMIFTKRWERARDILSDIERFRQPLPNVWLIHSASTQAEVDECVPILQATPAARRGLSLEPLLEHVQIDRHLWADHLDLDFAIVGGENSLRKALARPCPNGAPQSLLTQCRRFKVPFWFKGWGNNVPDGQVKGLLDGVRYEELP